MRTWDSDRTHALYEDTRGNAYEPSYRARTVRIGFLKAFRCVRYPALYIPTPPYSCVLPSNESLPMLRVELVIKRLEANKALAMLGV